MSRKLKRIKEQLTEAGLNTTGHVIMLIIRSQYLPMKIIFFLAWLVGFGLTLYLVTNNILDYYKYDVTTQTREIRDQSMILPKVTICNRERFVTNDSIPFLANVLRNDVMFDANINEATTAGATTDLELVNWFILNEVDFQSQALYAAFLADNTTRMSLGHDKETFVRYCSFNYRDCDLYDNLIEQIYDIKFGNCFTFNGQNKSKFKDTGSEILYLELFIGKPDDYETVSKSPSVITFIYNHSNYYSENEGIVIAGGFGTDIILSKKISETYPKPYSECEIKDNLKLTTTADYQIFDLFANSPYLYRSSDCRTFCYQEIILNNCNCIDNSKTFFNVKNIEIPKFCDWSNNSTDLDCYWELFENTNLDEVCGKSCPYECDQVKLSMSTSVTAILNDNQTLNLNIYFTDLSYEFTTESPAINVVALFSGLGGTLGLFLGFSVLSSCEAIDLLVNVIMIILKKDTINDQANSETPKKNSEKDYK